MIEVGQKYLLQHPYSEDGEDKQVEVTVELKDEEEWFYVKGGLFEDYRWDRHGFCYEMVHVVTGVSLEYVDHYHEYASDAVKDTKTETESIPYRRPKYDLAEDNIVVKKPRKKAKKDNKTDKRCPHCKNKVTGHPNKKFCGQKCKDRYHNKHNPRGIYAHLNPENAPIDDYDGSWDEHNY